MAHHNKSLELTAKDLAQCFSDPAVVAKFPPVLTVDQAADLLRVPRQTIYAWNSRGLLVGCARRVGKYLRIFRDRLLLKVMNEGITSNGR